VRKAKPGYKLVNWLFGKEIVIPENWNFDVLKQVSEKLVVGFVGTCDPFYTDKTGIPMLRTTNVKEGKLDLTNLKYVKKEFHEKNKKSQVQENDLLVSRHGENGEACLVQGLSKAHCLNIVIVRPEKKWLIPKFLELAFNSPIVRKQIQRTTAGGVQGVVNTSEISKVKIVVPPKDEQQKISLILSKIDNLIASYDKAIVLSKKQKKGLMQQLLTKGIGHTKFKKVKWLFRKEIEIPEEWEIEKLKDVVDFLDSQRIPIEESERENRHGKYPYYGASGIIDYIDDYIFDETLLCLAEDGENLRSRVLPIAFTIKGKTWVNNHAHVLRAKETTEHYFLEYFLNHLSFLKWVASTAQPKLNQKDLRSIPIISPPFKEQQKIALILSNCDSKISELESKRSNLERLKKGLMQKLLTGQIRVKV